MKHPKIKHNKRNVILQKTDLMPFYDIRTGNTVGLGLTTLDPTWGPYDRTSMPVLSLLSLLN